MLVIGHRGAPSLEKENTILSFQIALDHNVDGLEFDIQYTKDYQLIVYHDFHVSHNNQIINISDVNLKDLHSMNLSYAIPTFEEVIQICPKDKIINIEIKSKNIYHDKLIADIIKILIRYNLNDNIIISSFNPFVLLALKKQTNKFKIGLLWSKSILEKWYVTQYSYKFLMPCFFHADIEHIDKQMSNWVYSKGMKLFLYTVNNKQQLKIAYDVKADGIFSDYLNILE